MVSGVSVQKREAPMKELWKNYNLSIVLAILFVVSWIVQTVSGWYDYVNDQSAHQQAAQLSGYIYHWLAATAENWQSEFLQLLTFVILTSFLVHKGSHESKDNDEQVQAQLNRIEAKLERLERTGVR